MVWTPDDEMPVDLFDGLCDSCREPLTDDDAGRFRHRDCAPPELPAVARELLDRVRGAR